MSNHWLPLVFCAGFVFGVVVLLMFVRWTFRRLL